MSFLGVVKSFRSLFETKISYFSIMIFSYLMLFWILFYQISNTTVQLYGDSYSYLNLPLGYSFKELFLSIRPVASVWMFRLFADPSNFPFAQMLIYTSSVMFLWWVLSRLVRSKLIFLFACICSVLFFTHSTFSIWLSGALTEAVFFSLMVLALSFLLGIIFRPGVFYTVGATIVVVLLSLLRDVGAYYAALYGVLFALIFIFTRQKMLLVPFVVALSIFIFSSWSADQGMRWRFSMLNNFGTRILVSEEYRNYFADRGMPLNEALLDKAGVWASRKGVSGFGYNNDPGLHDFRIWLLASSKGEYMKFLLTHPVYSISSLINNRDVIFFGGNDFVGQYGMKGYKGVDYGVKNFYGMVYSILALVFFIGIVLVRRRDRAGFKYYFFGITYFSFLFPFAFIGYHGDAMEVPRHLLPVLFHAFLSGILFLLLLDKLVISREEVSTK